MEKCFTVHKDTQFAIDMNRYDEYREEQRKFVVEFFDNQGIEAKSFIVGGNGFVNQPFKESQMKDIGLSIDATESDVCKFGKQLKIPNKKHGLCGFKSNSKILKMFAECCVEKSIIINLHKPSLRDYFNSLGYNKFSSCYFEHGGNCYCMIDSEYLTDDDIPEGFSPIKISEYYKVVEEIEEVQNTKY